MTGTRLVDSGVLNILNTFTAGLDNDFVADMLKVMDVGRDGGRRRWISRRYDQQAKPSRECRLGDGHGVTPDARAAVGVDGATPSADAADIAISREPGVTQMSQLLVARAARGEYRISFVDTWRGTDERRPRPTTRC